VCSGVYHGVGDAKSQLLCALELRKLPPAGLQGIGRTDTSLLEQSPEPAGSSNRLLHNELAVVRDSHVVCPYGPLGATQPDAARSSHGDGADIVEYKLCVTGIGGI